MNAENITIIVETPFGNFSKDYAKTEKLRVVLDATIAHFELERSDNFSLVVKDDLENELNLNRTIVSYHFENGTILELTDIGVAV